MSMIYCFEDGVSFDSDWHEQCPHGCDREIHEVLEDENIYAGKGNPDEHENFGNEEENL